MKFNDKIFLDYFITHEINESKYHLLMMNWNLIDKWNLISTKIIFYFILTFIKVIQTWKWEREWTSYSFSGTKHPLIIFKRIYWNFQIYFVYNKKIFLFILLKKRINFYNFIKKKYFYLILFIKELISL